MAGMKKRLPAYGHALLCQLDKGMEPFHGIGVWIDRMPPERALFARLAVFQDAQPDHLDWSMCSGRDVFILHADSAAESRLKSVCHAIRDARPRRLILLLDHPTPHSEFVVSVNGGRP